MTKRQLPEGRRPLSASDSADLVKKMHDKLAAGFTAGDRISQLEELYEAAKQDANEAEAYAEELEDKLAKAYEYQIKGAQGIARATLAELKGELKDG